VLLKLYTFSEKKDGVELRWLVSTEHSALLEEEYAEFIKFELLLK